MSTRRSRLPVSSVNAVLVGILLAAAVVAAVVGRWSSAVLLALAAVAALVGALHARRQASGDVTRVRVGPFPSREAAEKERARLKSLGFEGNVTPR